jgi:hypothetical protein
MKKESNTKKEDKEGKRHTGIEETIMKMVKAKLDLQIAHSREWVEKIFLAQKKPLS